MKRSIVQKFINWSAYRFPKLYSLIPDEKYLKIKFWASTGKKLNLNNPTTYNEKLQWLKLHDKRPEYTMMVDKYEVKEYVASIIGKEFVIPTLGIWERFDDIPFDDLPNQFVLKCTHDSGGVVICKDKLNFDMNRARKIIQNSMKRNYFLTGREWPYKNVQPRIIAEEYMQDDLTSELRDYKFFTFNGIPRALFIATDRQKVNEDTKFDFFDMEFQHLPFTNGHPNASILPQKPITFDKMKYLAEKLAKGIPHLRVDFYEVNGKVYFGELTFSHWSGFMPFEPESWDYTFGSWLNILNDERIE